MNIGLELLKNRVCIDIFLAPAKNQTLDIATFA